MPDDDADSGLQATDIGHRTHEKRCHDARRMSF